MRNARPEFGTTYITLFVVWEVRVVVAYDVFLSLPVLLQFKALEECKHHATVVVKMLHTILF